MVLHHGQMSFLLLDQ